MCPLWGSKDVLWSGCIFIADRFGHLNSFMFDATAETCDFIYYPSAMLVTNLGFVLHLKDILPRLG